MSAVDNSPAAPPRVEVRRAVADMTGLPGSAACRGPFDLEVNGGEFFSFVGPDGCGKGMLLRLVAGLIPLREGEITIGGKRVESPQATTGIAFAEPNLMEWRTALENVMLQAEIRRLDRRKCAEQARRLLVMMGLEGNEYLKPHELTKPMQVRVSLCRALLPGPSLLLMHDPFRGLDPLNREQIAIDLQRMMLTPAMTVILATQQIMEAVQLSDRVGVMSADGKILHCVGIDLSRPRRLDKATVPQLMEYCSAIRTSLQAQGFLR